MSLRRPACLSQISRNKHRYPKAVLVEFANLSNYITLFSKSFSLNPIQTAIEIEPKILGADCNTIELSYGVPDLIFSHKKFMVFVYKRALNNLKISYEVHFYEGKVFLIYHIYRQIRAEDKIYIVKKIYKKYLNRELDDTAIFSSKIVDAKYDSVLIDEFFCGLKITYLQRKEANWLGDETGAIDAEKTIKGI